MDIVAPNSRTHDNRASIKEMFLFKFFFTLCKFVALPLRPNTKFFLSVQLFSSQMLVARSSPTKIKLIDDYRSILWQT